MGRGGGSGRSSGGRSSGSRSSGGRVSSSSGRSRGSSSSRSSSSRSSSSSFSSSRSSGSRSRSSGGRSPGGSSRGGFGSSSGSSSIFGGIGSGRAYHNNHHHHHHHRPPRGYGYGYGAGRRNRSGGGGCLSSVLIFGLIILVISFALSSGGSNNYGSSDVTKSTIKREALPKGSVVETEYYTDQLGWIANKTKLIKGMRNFYIETGVQPYLYITDTVNRTNEPTEEDFDKFAGELYDELFKDEAHLLVIFHEYYEGEYSTWYICGSQAKTVIDSEAADILLDYFDRYYYGNLEDEEYFSKVFDETGEQIMHVEKSFFSTIAPYLIILCILALLMNWWKKAKKQKNLEAEQTERILNTPLEKFGDASFDELKNKYDE